MRLRKAFARNLRACRAVVGISQEALAKRAEIDRTYISALERCVYSASLDTIERIASALNVPAAELLRLPVRKAPLKRARGSHA